MAWLEFTDMDDDLILLNSDHIQQITDPGADRRSIKLFKGGNEKLVEVKDAFADIKTALSVVTV